MIGSGMPMSQSRIERMDKNPDIVVALAKR